VKVRRVVFVKQVGFKPEVKDVVQMSLKWTGMSAPCAHMSLALMNDVNRYCMLSPEPPSSFYTHASHTYRPVS